MSQLLNADDELRTESIPMASKSVSAISPTGRKSPVRALTIDQIRDALRKKTPHHQLDPRDPLQPMESPKREVSPSTAAAFSKLTEAVLVYCSLLDRSRTRVVGEATGLREVVRQLEEIVDTSGQREVETLKQVQKYSEKLSEYEKKYYLVKNRAKLSIKECQEDRDRWRLDSESVTVQVKELEAEFDTCKIVISAHNTEIGRLRETSKNLMSQKKADDLKEEISRLETENEDLVAETAQLQSRIEDTKGQLKKIGLSPVPHVSPEVYSARGEERSAATSQLRAQLEALGTQKAEQRKTLQQLLDAKQAEASRSQERAGALLAQVDALYQK